MSDGTYVDGTYVGGTCVGGTSVYGTYVVAPFQSSMVNLLNVIRDNGNTFSD